MITLFTLTVVIPSLVAFLMVFCDAPPPKSTFGRYVWARLNWEI